MSDYESDLSVEQIFSPRELPGSCVVSDEDTETLEWIHGTDLNGTEFKLNLSGGDILYLVEHLFLNMMNLMLGGNTLGGAWSDSDGEEQLRNWRLINLLCVKSEAWTIDDVKEKFLELCEVHGVENNPEILGLFDRYVV